MRQFSAKSMLATSLILSLLVTVTPVRATVYDINGIPEKNTGDAITAAEVNLMVDMLRNLRKDDRGDTDITNDRFGIGIAGTPAYMLDVNGTVNAAAFIGDGSQLTNLPNPSPWKITANDIYYNLGKVAIGINSSPTYQLEVHNTGDSQIQVDAGGTGNDAALRLKNDAQEWIIRNNGGTGDNFQITNLTSGDTVFEVDGTTNNITTSNDFTSGGNISGDTITATNFVDSGTGNPIGGGLWQEGAENDEIYYDADSVGIGTNNPTAALQVVGDVKLDEALAVGSSAGFNDNRVVYIDEDFATDESNFLFMAQGTASGNTTTSPTFRGGYIDAETTQVETSGNNYTEGLYSRARVSGSATFNQIRGLHGVAFNDSDAGTGLGTLIGVRGEAYNNDSSAKVPAIYGATFIARGRTGLPAGNVGGLYGSRNDAMAYESDVDTAYGTYNMVRTINGDTGSIDDAYGSYNQVLVDSAAGGDITNGYGVYSLLDGRAGSTEFTAATGVYSDVNNAVTAYGGRFYADDTVAATNYGIVVSAANGTNNYGIFGTDGDWVLDADGDGALGGTGSDLIIGEGADLRIFHNGTDSVIQNQTGDLVLQNNGSGNVGIGTNTPAAALTVGASTPGYGTVASIAIDVSGADDGNFIFAQGGSPEWAISNDGPTARFDIWSNAGSWWVQRFSIDSTGDVGIGDTTPDGTLKLDVEGQIGATEYCDQNGANCIAAGSIGAGVWTENGTDAYYDAGDVGIGTNNPDELLHLASDGPVVFKIEADSDNSNENDTAQIQLSQDGGLISGRLGFTNTNDMELISEYDDELHFGTDDTIRMTIEGNGNVGIGSSAASEKLHIEGPIANIRLTDTDTGADNYIATNSSVGGMVIQADQNNEVAGSYLDLSVDGATRMRVNNDGNVGIGTSSPQEKLEVEGTILSTPINFAGNQDQAYLIAGANIYTGATTNWGTAGFQHRIKTNAGGTPRVTIDTPSSGEAFSIENGGSVGIGDATPDGTLKLDVEGRVGATEYCDENGANCTLASELGSGYWSKTGDDVWYNPGATGEVGIGISNPSEELVVSRAQAAPTTIAVLNTSSSNNTDTRAGFAAQSVGAGLDMMVYSPAATGSIGDQTKADAAFVRTVSSQPASKMVIGNGGNSPLHLITNDATRMTVLGNGNVGIGTNSPSAKLEIDGGTNTDVLILADNGGASTLSLHGDSQGTGRVYVGQSTTYGGGIEYNGDNSPVTTGAGADYTTLFNRSNGTEDWTARSQVNSLEWEFRNNLNLSNTLNGSEAAISANSAVGGVQIMADTNSAVAGSYVGLNVDGTEHLRVTETGDVGIGDTTPDGTLKLDVEGRIGATQYCDQNGANCIAAGALGTGYWSKTGDDVWYNPGATGEVGIGISNPSEELVVNRAQAAPTTIAVLNSSSSNNTNTRAGFTAQSNQAAIDMMVYGSAATGSLAGQTKADAAYIRTSSGSPSSKMVIGNGGNVPVHLITNDTTRMTVEANGDITHTGSLYSDDGTFRSRWMRFQPILNGNSVGIGSGGHTAIGSGESADQLMNNIAANTEQLSLGGDGNIRFYTGIQSGWGSRVEAMEIEATGSVGIGTMSPSEELHVFKNQANPTTIAVGNTSASNDTNTRAGFTAQSNQAAIDMMVYGSAATGSLAGQTKADAAYIRTSSGSPSSKMVIGNGGNVPVHLITNDTTRLTVQADGDIDTNENTIYLRDAGGSLFGMGYAVHGGAGTTLFSDTSITLTETDADAEKFRFDVNSGEAGFGTASPSEELHVFNNQANPTTIVSGNTSASTNTNTRAGFTAAANAGQLDIYHMGSLASGATAGITKADAAFIRTASSSPSSSLNIGNGAAAPLNLFTTDAVRMTIEGGGDVGIGLTNPSEKLEVAGTIRASSFVQSSDKRLKKNIKVVQNPLDVLTMRGVTFDWKDSGKGDYGFIAQELETLYPELINTNPDTGLKAVNYAGMSAVLLEALKTQQTQLETLSQRLETLEKNQK